MKDTQIITNLKLLKTEKRWICKQSCSIWFLKMFSPPYPLTPSHWHSSFLLHHIFKPLSQDVAFVVDDTQSLTAASTLNLFWGTKPERVVWPLQWSVILLVKLLFLGLGQWFIYIFAYLSFCTTGSRSLIIQKSLNPRALRRF